MTASWCFGVAASASARPAFAQLHAGGPAAPKHHEAVIEQAQDALELAEAAGLHDHGDALEGAQDAVVLAEVKAHQDHNGVVKASPGAIALAEAVAT